MTNGEWWRKSGPWSGASGGGGSGSGSGSASGAGSSSGAGSASGPGADSDDGSSVYDSAAPGVPGMASVPLDPPRDAPDDADPDAVPPPPQVIHSGADGWDLVMLNFSDAPPAPPKPVPEQRAGEGDAPAKPEASAGPVAKPDARPKKQKKAKAAGAPKKSTLAGRRPSPLLLLAAGLLAGGAFTGFFPAMLAGSGLGYLSRQLTDLTRKFAILGIPLITMSATTLYQMQQAKHGQGGLQPGSQLGQMTWASAPGVLRLSAALTAAFLLLMALRRRPPQEG